MEDTADYLWGPRVSSTADDPPCLADPADRFDQSTETGGRWTLRIDFDMDEELDDAFFAGIGATLAERALAGQAKVVRVSLTDNST